MKNLIVILFFSIMIPTVHAHENPEKRINCSDIIATYEINPKIKSVRGWKRVFDSEKWKKIFKLDVYNEDELKCLEKYILENAMNVKNYNRFVGMELKL